MKYQSREIRKEFIMGSKITIAPGNVMHLYEALTHMVELGYDDINANCVYEKGQRCYADRIEIANVDSEQSTNKQSRKPETTHCKTFEPRD